MAKGKERPKVYLVQDLAGSVMTTFHSEEDAQWFCDQLNDELKVPKYVMQARTLYYGQPPHRGYNP